MIENLEKQFHHAMIGVADFANQHHFGIRFRQMIDEHGAVEAAKRLLATQDIQTGLMRLWKMKSLSKSMETLVIQERFLPLFTEAEIAEARRRLEELGYFKMSAVQPFGEFRTATILIIGHDPRLQNSQAEAEKAFFFEYLENYQARPTYGPDARKYDLAHAVWDYVNKLAGCLIPLDQLYVTNLCNEFLPSSQGGGTVLIPDQLAERGVEAIRAVISQGNFRLILPMSVQTFYHLCRLGFLDEKNDKILAFINKARPTSPKIDLGVYKTSGKAPFLEVCGRLFHHQGIPLVPIVHVKQWPLKTRAIRYAEPMQQAKHEVRKALTII